MVKQVDLVELGTWVLMFLITTFILLLLLPLFQICLNLAMAAHNLFPAVAELQLAGAHHASVLSWLYTVSIECNTQRQSF